MERLAAVAAVIAGLGCRGPAIQPGRTPSNRPDVTGTAPVDAERPPSRWARRCRDAMETARTQASAIEPALATMAVDIDTGPDREEVAARGLPPAVATTFHLRARRPPDRETPRGWLDVASSITIGNRPPGDEYRAARKVTRDVEVAMWLDGWAEARADAVVATIKTAIEPCFDVEGDVDR